MQMGATLQTLQTFCSLLFGVCIKPSAITVQYGAIQMVLLRTADAARRLGVSASFLEKARVNGSGPSYVKIGRTVAYRDADIDAWVASLVRHSTSASALGQ